MSILSSGLKSKSSSAPPAAKAAWLAVPLLLCLGSQAAEAACGTLWTPRVSGTTAALRGVAWNGSTFVVVGNNSSNGSGVVLTSSTGLKWTLRDPKTPGSATLPGSLNGVAWGDGRFVAVGNGGTILTSLDGKTWTSQQSGVVETLYAVTFGGGKYIATGDQGVILSSPDGENWTPQESGTPFGSLNGVAWNDKLFVAAGADAFLSRVVLTSPDAVKWTPRNQGTSAALTGVTYGAGQFVAVGYQYDPDTFTNTAVAMTSPDGAKWALRYSGFNGWLAGATWTGKFYAAVGGNFPGPSAVLVSSLGRTWVQRDSSPVSKILYGVAFGPDRLVAVGAFGTIATSACR